MEITQDMLMQYGLMQKLSTGHSLLDALLVMLVPLLINHLLPQVRSVAEKLQKWWKKNPTSRHERVIVHKQKTGDRYYYDTDNEDMPNHKLQQAILVYLNTLPHLFSQLESANVQLCKCKRVKQAAVSVDLFEDDDDGDHHHGDGSSSTSEDSDDWYPGMELEQYEVALVPPLDTWIDVEPGVELMRGEERQAGEKESTLLTTFWLAGDSAEQIDTFINRAWEAYKNMIKGEQKSSKADRHLYLPVSMGPEGTSDSQSSPHHITYRRYKLTDDKSFCNFFHPDKENILTLVENFSNKQGKFAIQGYPQKLGFLLHGPPGTGKTTFIKALASHTKRSIINIPLSRISTNQQLMDFMYDERVKVEGIDLLVPLPFHKVIYVMEDVDAASHVVQKREGGDPVTAIMASMREASAREQEFRAAKELDQAANAAIHIGDLAPAAAGKTGPPTKAAAAASAFFTSAAGRAGFKGSGGDELNLAGLLNVLDGVVDTPGRLVIMTTNHPERLDPALIRPGRINKQVYMGNIAAAEALRMVQHYFGELQLQEEKQLLTTWADGVVPFILLTLHLRRVIVADPARWTA
eukprot:gene4999-5240_t